MSTSGAGQQVLDDSSSSGRALGRWRLPTLFDRVRLAPLFVVCVLGVAVFTDTLSHPLPAPLLDAWGFRVSDLFVEPWRILTCPFFIYRPSMALSIVGIVLLFVGLAELRVGLEMDGPVLSPGISPDTSSVLSSCAVDALLGFGGDMAVVTSAPPTALSEPGARSSLSGLVAALGPSSRARRSIC
ncbi:MAG: hypothetical protein R3E12_09650 [Candidatus Eisenbacteria bacterium]